MALSFEKSAISNSKIVVGNADGKYGTGNMGVFASQNIQQGEFIFKCDTSTCDYIIRDTTDSLKTKDEFIKCCEMNPDCKDFMLNYQYMVDHDTYLLPRLWKEKKLLCICAFFNHSCNPNSGLNGNASIVSLKNITEGEELTFDYQILDTEASFYSGLSCKCGSNNCRGVLSFDQYRNIEWQNKFYDYSTTYVKNQIDNLKTKWFSSKCCVKRFKPSQKGLVALQSIEKDALVATFSNDVKPESHYLRLSANPTCYLISNRVYTAKEIVLGEELTLDYSNSISEN